MDQVVPLRKIFTNLIRSSSASPEKKQGKKACSRKILNKPDSSWPNSHQRVKTQSDDGEFKHSVSFFPRPASLFIHWHLAFLEIIIVDIHNTFQIGYRLKGTSFLSYCASARSKTCSHVESDYDAQSFSQIPGFQGFSLST